MRGDNPIRPPLTGDGATLEVKEIFATRQGEGPYTGQSAVFIRLGGCNLSCMFCDTDFEDFAVLTLDAVMAEVCHLAIPGCDLAVMTGGEPLRQPVAPLCAALLQNGFRVQIETNGTLFRPLPEGVEIVCSPKPAAGRYHPLRPDLLERVSALKFLVSVRAEGYGEVPEIGQSAHAIPVYVQPMDEYDEGVNARNLVLAQRLAHEGGYLLSEQMHKHWKIR